MIEDVFRIIKADRYTKDGCDEIQKAKDNLTEDEKYNIGDISKKTGLQKTANGWVKPKSGKQTDAKNAETNYGKVEKKDGKWGVQQKLGKGSQFIEHKDKKDATEALKNYTEGYNTTARSKQNPHSDEARQVKQWNKETEKIKKENRAERRAEHAAQFQNQEKARKDAEKPGTTENKRLALAENLVKNFKQDPETAKKVVATMSESDVEKKYKNLQNTRYEKPGRDYPSKKNGGGSSSDKWQKTKDYLGRERISMKTPQGGMVSIYEADNPNQKNNRFRVDTGSHADYFNSMEEAKAFAEKHYGPDSKSTSAQNNEQESVWSWLNREYELAGKNENTESKDCAPRQLTGDCKIRIRK